MLRDIRETPAASDKDGPSAHLVALGELNDAALDRALKVAAESGERLEIALTRLGLVSERDLADALASLLDLPIAAAGDYPDAPVLEEKLPGKFLREWQVLPLEDTAGGVVLAMVHPRDTYAANAVCFAVGKPVLKRVAHPADFEAAYERLYGEGKSAIRQIADTAQERVGASREEDVDRLKDIASEAPVIRLVNLLIARAGEARASDIHIGPMESELRVRYRIDGVLQLMESPRQRPYTLAWR
jgi:general secretion pathway protein E